MATLSTSHSHPTVPADSRPGATIALGMSTAAFTVCFAAWTIFSILGIQIQKASASTRPSSAC
jgi:NNP family nitrate/nitrite transporter-like MFS transporter